MTTAWGQVLPEENDSRGRHDTGFYVFAVFAGVFAGMFVLAAFVIVMLLASVLPRWFVSPPKVAVAVHPFATVTFRQSPL